METDAKMTEAALNHDAKLMDKASKWVVNLNGIVRPGVTFIFVFELVLINMGLAWFLLFKEGLGVLTVEQFIAATNIIFSETELSMLGAIIGYWFGSRSWSRK
jgi:hypothetical protein